MANKKRICSVDGCGKPYYVRGLCKAHHSKRCYQAKSAVKRAARGWPTLKAAGYIESLVGTKEAECIIFPYRRNRDGYGRLSVRGRLESAHRLMCILAHGEPPAADLHAAHWCNNGHLGCVNPNHIRWATYMENHLDKVVKGTDIAEFSRKLTWDEVKEIRALADVCLQRDLGLIFGVSQSTIHKIVTHKLWAG